MTSFIQLRVTILIECQTFWFHIWQIVLSVVFNLVDVVIVYNVSLNVHGARFYFMYSLRCRPFQEKMFFYYPIGRHDLLPALHVVYLYKGTIYTFHDERTKIMHLSGLTIFTFRQDIDPSNLVRIDASNYYLLEYSYEQAAYTRQIHKLSLKNT